MLKKAPHEVEGEEGDSGNPPAWEAPVLLIDKVQVDIELRGEWLFPGGQTASVDGTPGYDALIPPVPVPRPAPKLVALPAAVPLRAVRMRAETPDEARAVVVAARGHGLNAVWLDVGPVAVDAVSEKQRVALLEAAVAEGRGTKGAIPIRVFADIAVLRSAENAGIDPLLLDRNRSGQTSRVAAAEIMGLFTKSGEPQPVLETTDDSPVPLFPDMIKRLFGMDQRTDWIRSDTDLAAIRVRKGLAVVAAIPGLAGMTLRDTCPPSFAPRSAPNDSNSIADFTMGAFEFGFTSSARVDFLRRRHSDPSDLLGEGGMGMMSASRTEPQDPEVLKTWRDERYTDNTTRVTKLVGDAEVGLASGFATYIQNRAATTFTEYDFYTAFAPGTPLPFQRIENANDDLKTLTDALHAAEAKAGAGSVATKPILVLDYQIATFSTFSRGFGGSSLEPFVVFDPGQEAKPRPTTPTDHFGYYLNSRLAAFTRLDGRAGVPWGGVVFNLSHLSAKDALPLLDAFASPPPPAAAATPSERKTL